MAKGDFNNYRLLAGLHVGPDYSQDPVPVKDRDGTEVGERYPSKMYRPGMVVESPTDLVARHGAGKFALVGPSGRPPLKKRGTDTPDRRQAAGEDRNAAWSTNPTLGDPAPAQDPTSFPAGQVATGFQETTGVDPETDPFGRSQVSGPASPKTVERTKELHEEAHAASLDKAESKRAFKATAEDRPTRGRAPAPKSARRAAAQADEEDEGDSDDDLDHMTVLQLKERAAAEGVDLEGASRKDEIVDKIRASRG